MTIEGVTVDEHTDFASLAIDALRGRLGYSRSTTDGGPLDWLFRAWPQLQSSAFADRLAQAIGEQVNDTDEAAKHAALLFLIRFPDAAARASASLQRAYMNRAAFRGVYPPDGGSADLEWWLMRALAGLAAASSDATQMRMIEDEALRPDGKVEPIIHTLVTKDHDWFARHRDEIVRLHPEVKDVIETIEQGQG